MLSHTLSGRLGGKDFSANIICILSDFTKPVVRYSHRFGQDLDMKQKDPAAETRALLNRALRKEIKYQSSS